MRKPKNVSGVMARLHIKVAKRSILLLLLCWIFIPLGSSVLGQQMHPDTSDVVLDSLLNTPVQYSLFNTQVTAGAKYGQLIQQVPASVSIVPSNDVETYGYRTLEDIFRSTPGFFVSNDRNYSYVGIRGFGRPSDYNSRLLLLVNGHTMNESVFGSALIGTELGLDLFPFERVEVVRGPGSALYGTGAMLGVVNLVTKKGNAIDGIHVGAEAGSVGRRQVTLTIGKEFSDGLDFLLHSQVLESRGEDLYFKEFDAPETNNGFASGLDGERSVGALATVKYKGLSLQGIMTSRDKDIPTAPYETIFGDPATKTRDRSAFFEVKYENPLDLEKRIMVRGYVDSYRYQGNWGYNPPSLDAASGTWSGGEIQFLWDILPMNRLVCGGEYRNNWQVKYRSWDASAVYFDRNAPFSLFSLYVQDDLQITENLSITLGARHDSYSDKGASTMPRAMIVFWPTHNTSVKLGYGEAFRTPNFNELYYEDLPTKAKANPSLKPEQMRTLELILEQRLTDEISASLSLYRYRMTNLIDQAVDLADSFSQYQNRSSVDASGGEFEVRAKLPWGQFVRASYSRQCTHDEVTESQLTNSPMYQIKLGSDISFLETATAALEMLYEGGRATLSGSTTKPYLLTNINFSARPWRGHLTCSLLVKNLFNTRYELPGGLEHRQNAIVQEKRGVIFKAEMAF